MISQDAASRGLPDEAFIAKCLEFAHRNGNHSGTLSVPGLSRALLANGLRVADNRGLRAGDDPDAEVKRKAFLDELEFTADALSALNGIAQST